MPHGPDLDVVRRAEHPMDGNTLSLATSYPAVVEAPRERGVLVHDPLFPAQVPWSREAIQTREPT